MIEDSSGKHGNGSTHSGRSKQQRGSMQRSGSGSGTGTGSSASGGSSSGRRGLDKAAEQGLANAKVLIEDPNELEMFDWGAYWGSLPKKLKGKWRAGWLPVRLASCHATAPILQEQAHASIPSHAPHAFVPAPLLPCPIQTHVLLCPVL